MKNKKIRCFSLIVAISFLFMVLSVSTGATYLENSNSMTIVEYDYATKTETLKTLNLNDLKTSIAQSVYANTLNNGDVITMPYIPSFENECNLTYNERYLNFGSVDVSEYPYRSILYLYMRWEDDTGESTYGYGTGFLMGRNVMVTAGHNLYDFWEDRGHVAELQIYLRQDGTVTNFYYPQSWIFSTEFTQNENTNFDWCVVTLANDLGGGTGWMGRGYSANNINDKNVTLSGYAEGLKIQFSSQGTTFNSKTYTVNHTTTALDGMSGAPLYDENYIVWAIHVGVDTSNRYLATRITEDLYNIIQSKYLEGEELYG